MVNSIKKSQVDAIKVRAPGRANILGEHIDYCGGKVLPFALEQYMQFKFTKTDKKPKIIAEDLEDDWEYGASERPAWAHYFNTMLEQLKNKIGYVPYFDLVFNSTIPIGGGLSSSSALCCGFLSGINKLYDLALSKRDIIKLASEAEYGLGLQGGLMDQCAIMYSKAEHALLLDCDDMSMEHIYLDPDIFSFYLIDTGVKHQLVDSPYNDRKMSSQQGLNAICSHKKQTLNYRELNMEDLEVLNDVVQIKSLRHVVSEIKRVDLAVKALMQGNPVEMGQLMNETHRSLSTDYKVSCAEADFLVNRFQDEKGVYGARMIGGGFGGHVLILLKPGVNLNFMSRVQEDYKEAFGLKPNYFKASPSSGLSFS